MLIITITFLGDKDFQWSVESFFQNPDAFIDDMDKTADVCKEQREQFILLVILPHLEQHWGKCSASNAEIYKNLAKISCSVNSGIVVRHSLKLFIHLICKDNFGNDSENLLAVEAITRSSIFSSEGLFKKDEHSEQALKLSVYSHILSLLLMQQAQDIQLPIVSLEQHMEKVQEELKRRCNQIKSKKKDRFRYSMEFILETISYLLKPQGKSKAKLKGYLEECHKFCENPKMIGNDLKMLRTLKKIKKGESMDLHCVLTHLHGKVRIPKCFQILHDIL